MQAVPHRLAFRFRGRCQRNNAEFGVENHAGRHCVRHCGVTESAMVGQGYDYKVFFLFPQFPGNRFGLVPWFAVIFRA